MYVCVYMPTTRGVVRSTHEQDSFRTPKPFGTPDRSPKCTLTVHFHLPRVVHEESYAQQTKTRTPSALGCYRSHSQGGCPLAGRPPSLSEADNRRGATKTAFKSKLSDIHNVGLPDTAPRYEKPITENRHFEVKKNNKKGAV